MPVLYYVRHGETDFNRQGRLQGRRDTPLNAHGRQQAAECGVLLRDLFARDHRQAQDFKYVSSPLKRARETMEILRATLGLQVDDYEIDARLIEIAYGEWEGLTLQEIEMRNASVLSARERDKWDFAPPGGESYRELADRKLVQLAHRRHRGRGARGRCTRADGDLKHRVRERSDACTDRAGRRLCFCER